MHGDEQTNECYICGVLFWGLFNLFEVLSRIDSSGMSYKHYSCSMKIQDEGRGMDPMLKYLRISYATIACGLYFTVKLMWTFYSRE